MWIGNLDPRYLHLVLAQAQWSQSTNLDPIVIGRARRRPGRRVLVRSGAVHYDKRIVIDSEIRSGARDEAQRRERWAGAFRASLFAGVRHSDRDQHVLSER